MYGHSYYLVERIALEKYVAVHILLYETLFCRLLCIAVCSCYSCSYLKGIIHMETVLDFLHCMLVCNTVCVCLSDQTKSIATFLKISKVNKSINVH